VLASVGVKIKEDGELSESTTRSLPLGEVEIPGELTFEGAGICSSSGFVTRRGVGC
jgi:hypothetical protein